MIHEMFGDGIMSAIDFEIDIQKKPDPKGDRVVVTTAASFSPTANGSRVSLGAAPSARLGAFHSWSDGVLGCCNPETNAP